MIELLETYAKDFKDEKTINDFLNIPAEKLREIGNRYISHLQKNNRGYYLKGHLGIGWGEIFKNILSLKWPVIDAETEWLAIQHLQKLGVTTVEPVGYGVEGWNPATRKSFIITKDIGENLSLEQLSSAWTTTPPTLAFKRALIDRVAEIARKIHSSGVNHRDFYLCHFLIPLKEKETEANIKNPIVLVDLHRMQIRNKPSERWIVKDLGALYFSSIGIGLTTTDCFRFMKAYSQKTLSEVVNEDSPFWRKVRDRAKKTYRSHWKRDPPCPFI